MAEAMSAPREKRGGRREESTKSYEWREEIQHGARARNPHEEQIEALGADTNREEELGAASKTTP